MVEVGVGWEIPKPQSGYLEELLDWRERVALKEETRESGLKPSP